MVFFSFLYYPSCGSALSIVEQIEPLKIYLCPENLKTNIRPKLVNYGSGALSTKIPIQYTHTYILYIRLRRRCCDQYNIRHVPQIRDVIAPTRKGADDTELNAPREPLFPYILYNIIY